MKIKTEIKNKKIFFLLKGAIKKKKNNLTKGARKTIKKEDQIEKNNISKFGI
jgi:hypothetical protein